MVKHLKLAIVENTLSFGGCKGRNNYWKPKEMAVAVRDGYLLEAVKFSGGTGLASVLAGRKLGNKCPDLNLLPLDLLSVPPPTQLTKVNLEEQTRMAEEVHNDPASTNS